jgi:triphosphoribosyl-dephospho-CoA synthetase
MLEAVSLPIAVSSCLRLHRHSTQVTTSTTAGVITHTQPAAAALGHCFELRRVADAAITAADAAVLLLSPYTSLTRNNSAVDPTNRQRLQAASCFTALVLLLLLPVLPVLLTAYLSYIR